MNDTEAESVPFIVWHRGKIGKKKPSQKAVKDEARTTSVIGILATLPVSKGVVSGEVAAIIRKEPS